MHSQLILASGSKIRAALLQNAGVDCVVAPVRVDEDAAKSALLADDTSHRDVADALAELKARRGSSRHPAKLTLGADQVLSIEGQLLSKAKDENELSEQLCTLSGKAHVLYSAAVIYLDGEPQWRHVGQAQMIMRPLSKEFIDRYIAENWQGIQHCVGGYMLESTGAQLFSRVQGDYFSVLGLPLLEILGYLRSRGILLS